jgi:hypothetical protein
MDDTTWLSIAEDAVRLHRWSASDPASVVAVEERHTALDIVTTGR